MNNKNNYSDSTCRINTKYIYSDPTYKNNTKYIVDVLGVGSVS
jgi:hypothetical protein